MRLTDGNRIVDVRICQRYLCFLSPDCSTDILRSEEPVYNAEKDAYFVKSDIDLIIEIARAAVQEVDDKNLEGPAANPFIRWEIFVEEVENNV